MIKRELEIQKLIKPGKVLIIYGARQVGKTTLVKRFLDETDLTYRYDTGDNFQIVSQLSQCTYQSTDNHVGNKQLVVIDEAQKIPNIGTVLKLMVDRYPDKFFIATGSSSFELANQTGESLTGRKSIATLFPVAQVELLYDSAPSEITNDLPEYLIYGGYPEVISTQIHSEKEEILNTLAYSYLMKDILEFDRIKNSAKMYKLLKLVAFQIGSEVSANELANNLNIDVKTVLNYLDLLEKSFVIFSLGGFSRNLRKEVSKRSKYYFFDIGIRNAVINNFNEIADRNDIGQLWENFLMVERRKKHSYQDFHTNYYFWRTYDQKEIDLVEENGGKLNGFEFKWKNVRSKVPKLWLQTYSEATYTEINTENYLNFVT
ncbi:hypothetical protein CO180_01950 [candidate division WWE3 bacterium CG_4_9_14_3_um_filter_41_6]|uniref:ATPase n=2 Tax=Katanobacteria TaxID=422282 RepID=A0A2M7THE2_UNCKA|nr:MAG: hypothetical protein COY32_05515 [candidate division WWE3 bacterium CG_4_10_14_0_2_um_filter_41_14]PJA38939.1 MAG: hypothetical protein CO180_01950 [candidate division WWE3 bacterium CG_4_9_14_3_um_filter_41_6]